MMSVCKRAFLTFALLGASCGGDTNRKPEPARDAAAPATALDAGSDAAVPGCELPADGLPSDVFCTGLYVDRDPTRHASDARPYTPGVTLWSDGAKKHRYLFLPPGTTIDSSDMDAWKFPVGTKAWKEFEVDGVRVETRLFWKRAEHDWVSGTYVWDERGEHASLDTSKKPTILPGGYEIPIAKDCGKCHHGGADKLLGVEAVALGLPTAEGMTLDVLAREGLLSHPPPSTSLQLPEDDTGKAAAALGYLHANCGMPCHSTRGLGDETQLLLRVRADEIWPLVSPDAGRSAPVDTALTDTYLATVNQPPTTASVAQQFPGQLRIVPGSHEQSLVWQLAHRRGDYQMPPLVSHKLDEAGTRTVADWIDALAAP
jgi:hypothetical protein